MDEVAAFVGDIAQLQECLTQYRDFLEDQRAETIKNQFREFSNSLGIVASPKTINSLFHNFEDVTGLLDNSDIPIQDRILKTLESDFVQQVLTLKTAARESELRRMTFDLSEFIRNIPTADNDAQWIQNLMATSLKTLASEVSLQKESGDTYNEAWIISLQEQAEEIFKNF